MNSTDDKKREGFSHKYPSDLVARFWKKVDKNAGPNGCWIWVGAIGTSGYGNFNLSGKTSSPHRVAYIFEVGWTKDKYVCHHCDVKLCVNPKHLFLGTQLDNMSDAAEKGKPNSRNRKLTQHNVHEIRTLLKEGRLLHKEIGRRFGVTRSTIGAIKNRVRWSSLEETENA